MGRHVPGAPLYGSATAMARPCWCTYCNVQYSMADLPTFTHCAWVSRICILFPPTIAKLMHKIRCKVRIFSCTTVYFPYILRKLPISHIILLTHALMVSIKIITHLTQNRLAPLQWMKSTFTIAMEKRRQPTIQSLGHIKTQITASSIYANLVHR